MKHKADVSKKDKCNEIPLHYAETVSVLSTVQVKRNLAISARVCKGIRKFSAYCCTAICGLPNHHLRVSSAMFVNKRTIRTYVRCR